MLKNLVLACAVTILSGWAAGCGDSGNSNNDLGGGQNPDLAMKGGNDGGGNNPDMAPSCVMTPMTTTDFLNSCHSAAIDRVDITPFYPALAPAGVLPALP